MRAANLVQHGLTGLQAQVVRVVETQSASRLLQLFRGQSLQRGLGGHRHEDGEFDRAMGEVQDRSPSFGRLVWSQNWSESLGMGRGEASTERNLAILNIVL